MTHEPNFVSTPEELGAELKSEDEQERIDAAWALSELGRKALPALGALIEALKKHPEDPGLVGYICDALKSMSPESKVAEPHLRALLHSENKAVRGYVSDVLLLFDNPEAYRKLEEEKQRFGRRSCLLVLLPVIIGFCYCLYRLTVWVVYG